MKKRKYFKNFFPLFSILFLFFTTGFCQDSTLAKLIGYKDINRDGVNDLFQDSNGDGVNDVNNESYRYQFTYQDENSDGINDLWIDKDGDGVNDLMVVQIKKMKIRPQKQWIDKDGDGILDADTKPIYNVDLSTFVLDANNDGKNDITGLEFDQNNLMGYRYGFVDEERNNEIKNFSDRDDDGMHDKFNKRLQNDISKRRHARLYDYFIDEDGDGITDGRGFKRKQKREMGQGHGKRNGP